MQNLQESISWIDPQKNMQYKVCGRGQEDPGPKEMRKRGFKYTMIVSTSMDDKKVMDMLDTIEESILKAGDLVNELQDQIIERIKKQGTDEKLARELKELKE